MNNTFSLSFSDNSFQLVHSTNDGAESKLVSCSEFLYPRPVPIDEVFSDANIQAVTDYVNSLKTENNLQEVDIVFSLPFNYAHIKRVAYPTGSEKIVKRGQIEWELGYVLSENIKKYKISVLKDSKNTDYSEALIVAINKTLIQCLQSIAEKSGTRISGVLLNCFALENYLDNSIAFSPDQNYIFLKIGEKYIEQHFFLGKEYLTSYIDSVNDLQNRTKEEVVLELSSERSKQVESLAQQMGNTNNFDLVIYGNSFSESLKDTLKNGLSLSVEYATIGSYPEKDGYKFIEAWGSIL